MSNQEVLDFLIKGKENYENSLSAGMCYSIRRALCKSENGSHIIMKDFYNSCPEFNPQFLEATRPNCAFWWLIDDKISRIKGFDKLISLYKEKVELEK